MNKQELQQEEQVTKNIYRNIYKQGYANKNMKKEIKCKKCGRSKFYTYQSKNKKIRFDICVYCNNPKTKRGQELSKLVDNKQIVRVNQNKLKDSDEVSEEISTTEENARGIDKTESDTDEIINQISLGEIFKEIK